MSKPETKFILWQVRIWDLFIKLIPFIISLSAIGAYYLGYKDWKIVYSVLAVLSISVALTWCFWVLYTIATLAIILENSGKSIKDLIKELQEIKKQINKK